MKSLEFQKLSISCINSGIRSNPLSEYERRTPIKWNSIYEKILTVEKLKLGVGTALKELEKDGFQLRKRDLIRVAMELRKFRRYKKALQVYEWMDVRYERYMFSVSDAAIQLGLIAKVRGVLDAEDFFLELPDTLKCMETCGALLYAYVQAKMKNKAESLFETMRRNGYLFTSLQFRNMMALYRDLGEYDKVESLFVEMKQIGIRLKLLSSYNIWLSTQGSVEKMEEIYEELNASEFVDPDWTTYGTMATLYIKMGLYEKAKECLRKGESTITGRNHVDYNYLISLHATIGIKEEVYRAWKVYKSNFPSIPNTGYYSMILSLIRIRDIEGAEKIYEEWVSSKSSYDARITNLLMRGYVKEGNLNKAESLAEAREKLNPSLWMILADAHIKEKRISKALSCLKNALAIPSSKSWKPKANIISAFFALCDEEGDTARREVLAGLLRQSGFPSFVTPAYPKKIE